MSRILIIRSQDIISDSRVLRYEQWMRENDADYKIVGWDRAGKRLQRENTDYCRIRAGFQQRSKGIFGRIKWNGWLLCYLFAHRKEYDVIHACDFDTVWPAILMRIWGKYVIFDIFDWFSDEVHTGKAWIDIPIKFMEKMAVRCAQLTILCEEDRLKQIQVQPRKYLVLPNIPNVDVVVPGPCVGKLSLAYVGGLVRDRGLEELMEVVASLPDIVLKIAGFGSSALVRMAEKYSMKYDNITYEGAVSYTRALEIMRSVDLIYAMYYTTNPNHRFAAPNKFYEAIFLGKPLVTTLGTLVGAKVMELHTGYVIAEGKDALYGLITSLRRDDLQVFTRNIDFCAERYKGEFSRVMDLYRDIVLK